MKIKYFTIISVLILILTLGGIFVYSTYAIKDAGFKKVPKLNTNSTLICLSSKQKFRGNINYYICYIKLNKRPFVMGAKLTFIPRAIALSPVTIDVSPDTKQIFIGALDKIIKISSEVINKGHDCTKNEIINLNKRTKISKLIVVGKNELYYEDQNFNRDFFKCLKVNNKWDVSLTKFNNNQLYDSVGKKDKNGSCYDNYLLVPPQPQKLPIPSNTLFGYEHIDYSPKYGWLFSAHNYEYKPARIIKFWNKRKIINVAEGICAVFGSDGYIYYATFKGDIYRASIKNTQLKELVYKLPSENVAVAFPVTPMISKKRYFLLYQIHKIPESEKKFGANAYKDFDKIIVFDLKNKQFVEIKDPRKSADGFGINQSLRIINETP